jgi:two-component system, chemotaxis family, chemotaxis protein CheV
MAGVLESVNQRTQLVGQNRLELLLFRLGGRQLYGINVFKVKEVLQCPQLNEIPKRNPIVRGVAHIRGATIPIMDMRQATGSSPQENIRDCFIIMTEYNRTTQGFLVSSVERIVNMNWGDIHPPPKGAGRSNYLTAVTELDGKIVEIIDVEKILAEVAPLCDDVSEEVVAAAISNQSQPDYNKHVLIVDDSSVARKQIQKVVESIGVETTVLKNGREALNYLENMVAEGKNPYTELLLVISDIEMPEMDGYTFTAEVRANPKLADMHIILHTSLSGIFNEAMVKKVGANSFLAKFHPDELAKRVCDRMNQLSQ